MMHNCSFRLVSGCVLAVLSAFAVGSGCRTPKQSPQLTLVERLYQDFAFETSDSAPPPGVESLEDQPKAVLERYFDPKLSELLIRDRECAARTGSICNLDASILWDSQDPAGTKASIRPGDSPETVFVTLTHFNGQSSRLTFILVKSGSGWKISDIHYGSGRQSLKTMLSRHP